MVASLAITLLLTGCEAGDTGKTGAGGAGATADQVADATPSDKSGKSAPGDVPELPPDPVKVTLPIPGTAAESDADRGEVLLSRSRYYRLDVDTVDKNVLVTVSRRWLYKDGFPAGLIAAIRKHPEVKQTDSRLFDSRDGKIEASQYIRWDPAESGSRAAALLLYVDGTDADGEARHELAISVDLEVDATLGKAKPKQTVKFDAMSVDLDLDVVARDAALTGDVDDLLAGLMAIGDPVEERDQDVEPWFQHRPELAEALDDAHLAHRHDDHRLPDNEHRDQQDDGQRRQHRIPPFRARLRRGPRDPLVTAQPPN